MHAWKNAKCEQKKLNERDLGLLKCGVVSADAERFVSTV